MTSKNAGELALATQTARGSVASVSTQRTNVIAAPFGPTFDQFAAVDVRSTRIGALPWRHATGGLGDVELVLRPKFIGLLLYAALGAKAVTGAADPWTHTFTLASTIPWLTAWEHFGGIADDRYMDAKVAQLVIHAEAGGVVTARASFVAASVAHRTAQETAVAVESTDHFLHRHGASALLVEGVAISSISSWTLTIDTGVALEESLAGPMPRMTGVARIGLVMRHFVADASLWKRMIYGSSSPANLAPPSTTPLTLGGSPVGVQFTLTEAASPARSLVIAIPQVTLGPIAGFEPGTVYGPIVVDTSMDAYAPSSGSPITATLKNSQSSY